MSESLDLHRFLAESDDRGLVLATIVDKEGSSYRGLGARMAVAADGSSVGLLSGGCLEDELVRRALEVSQGPTSSRVSFDLRSADDIVWGYGLGCAGSIEVLLEPVSSPSGAEHLELLRSVVDGRRALHVRTELSSPPRREVVSESVALWAPAKRLDGFLDEHLMPPVALVIVGAGIDARPLARIGTELGWQVRVVDPRARPRMAERFEGLEFIAELPEGLPGSLPVDHRSAWVLMSHHFLDDKAVLSALVGYRPGYLGVLGPDRRRCALLDSLAEDGVSINASALVGPLGLDLPCSDPASIALSIVAEIQARLGLGRRRG